MKVRFFQRGFNYSQDGPGNRLVVHLQGCNLRCPWCSNPEGMDFRGGEETEVEALFAFIRSCRRLFFDGGGVTFTGGECTLQEEALGELLRLCRAEGIHTAIETNGTFCMPASFYPLPDLIITDFKHYDPAKLKTVTGCTAPYRQNIAAYLASGKEVLVRTVLIKGFNACEEDAEHFAAFFEHQNTSHASFEFLLYHEYGKAKWEKLGKSYAVSNAFVTEETRDFFEEIYRKRGFRVVRC